MKKTLLILLLGLSVFGYSQTISLDPDFNIGTGCNAAIRIVKQLPNGRILIAGDVTEYNGEIVGRIARLYADGTLDTSFTPSVGGPIEAMIVDADGKVVVAASGLLIRFNTNGTVDNTFTPPAFNGYGPYRIVKQGNKYVIAGDYNVVSPNGTFTSGMSRLNSNGTLDTTFAANEIGSGSQTNIFIDSDNRIIMTRPGDFFLNASIAPNIVRFSADGNLDMSFIHGAAASGPIYAATQQPDGKYIATGNFESFAMQPKHLMVRLNEDGTVDDTFNYTTTIGLPEDGILGRDVHILPNGKILVGGQFKDALQDIEGTPDGSVPTYLKLLNTDGSTDTDFTTEFNGDVYDLDIQSDGKILVGGWFTEYDGTSQNSIARLDFNALLKNPEILDNAINVYPNPVSNNLFIELNNTNILNIKIQLYDVLGKQVYNATHNRNNPQINMSGFTNGIYMLKVIANDKSFVRKVVKH